MMKYVLTKDYKDEFNNNRLYGKGQECNVVEMEVMDENGNFMFDIDSPYGKMFGRLKEEE